MYKAQYFEEVFTDIQEAKEWYKKQLVGLEVRFANCIEDAILKILEMPTAYNIRHKNIRIAHPKTFPYNIHFYIEEETKTVIFIGIVFNKRKDAIKINR
jgi:mRNA-degrading endonuclease RelE of RelBE toxin-antitoxin system